MRSASRLLRGAAIAAALAISYPALAQSTAANKRFTPPDFAQYGPVNALDMVQRIPGFSIDGGGDRRGFGDNASNVLIDGERPSTKSDDIQSILSRIPASQVDHIDLIEQAGSSEDTRGKGQVINVVRKASTKLTGTWEVKGEHGERDSFVPTGSASLSLQKGKTTYELSAAYNSGFNRESGLDKLRDGNGALIDSRLVGVRYLYRGVNLSAGVKTKIGAAKLNLGGKFNWQRFALTRTSQIFSPANARIGTEILSDFSPVKGTNFELSGDVEFPLSKAITTKLIALHRQGVDNSRSSLDTTRPGMVSLLSSDSRYAPAESVLRLQNTWNVAKSHSVQFGAELAYNRLSAQFSGSDVTNGVTTPFNSADVAVSELRLEPFVSDVWTITPKFKVEAGLVFEKSQLRLAGANGARRNFSFLKPRLVATWNASKNTTFEFNAQRQVEQLDFNDFATSVDLGFGGQFRAGNAELVPEKNILLTALVRQKFMERGSLEVSGAYFFVDDTQDLVPVTVRDVNGNVVAIFDGAGNIGKSRRWSLQVKTTLPLDWLTKPLGIKGMEIKYSGFFRWSRVTDPVTGLIRSRSGRSPWMQSWDFRHDVGKTGFSWGFNVQAQGPDRSYFVDQFQELRVGTEFQLFAEYRKFKLGTLKFQISNPFDVPMARDFVFYSGTRAGGVIAGSRERTRSRDMRFSLSLSGKF